MAVRMLGSSQKGAVGYIGANRESFSGYNEYLAVGLYGAMYPQNHFSITVPGEGECNSDDLVKSSKKYFGQIFETGCNWMFNGYNESKTSYGYKYLRNLYKIRKWQRHKIDLQLIQLSQAEFE